MFIDFHGSFKAYFLILKKKHKMELIGGGGEWITVCSLEAFVFHQNRQIKEVLGVSEVKYYLLTASSQAGKAWFGYQSVREHIITELAGTEY